MTLLLLNLKSITLLPLNLKLMTLLQLSQVFGFNIIEIINNTRAGIVIFFRSKKRERAIGGQIQVPDTLT